MKTKKKILTAVIVLGLLFQYINVNGQFKVASIAETAYGLTVNGRATGNDILNKSGGIWEVNVWEDIYGVSGFGYKTYGTITASNGNFSLAQMDAYDPDVALTVDGHGNIHAFVVYYSFGLGGYYLEEYLWNPSSVTFSLNNGPSLIDAAATFGSSINIDTDDGGYFITVWENGGKIYAMTGNIASGSLTMNSVVAIGSAGHGTFPDVCFNNSSNDRVTYCYLDNNTLYVDEDSYSSLSSASSYTNLVASAGTNKLIFPRIACPNQNVGNAADWTVVVEETNNTNSWNIEGITYNTINGLSTTTYNDGVGSWGSYTPLNSIYNYNPVVTYDDQSNIFVGWNFDNRAGILSTSNSIYPIVLACDYDGIPLLAIPYYNVPQNLNSMEIKDYLSISGKNAIDECLYTYYDNTGSDVNFKSVTGAIAMNSLRSAGNNEYSGNEAALAYFNQNENVTILGKIIDINGRTIYEKKQPYIEFNNNLIDILKPYPTSLYLTEIKSFDNKYILKKKIISNY